MTRTELAWELAGLFADLEIGQINEALAKNVPYESLEFFYSYCESFGEAEAITGDAMKRLPNLMLLGYLLRVLEDRLLPDSADPS
ncbi:MAG: hypothetical protein ABFS46_01440 [Myxococcota bacterium]